MIVTDLDGTLLRKDRTISERTIDTLRRCRAAGIKTVYATGRGSSAEMVAPSELFDGKITMNGAVAKVGDSVVYNSVIPCLVARPFLLACQKRGLKIASEAAGMHHTNFTVPDEWDDVVENWQITDFTKHEKDAEKIYTFDLTAADINFIAEILPQNLYMVISIEGLAMIMHKDATKAKAATALAARWGIKPAEVVAFGDDLNDTDLLHAMGLGVAMGNARKEIKVATHHMCDTNDNDGIAKWLEENVL